MPVLQAVGDWIMWAIGALLTFVGVPAGTVIKRNRDRTVKNTKRLEGDPENPNDEGLMDIAHETRTKVDQLEARMEREHREVMSKLDEISDGQYEVDE